MSNVIADPEKLRQLARTLTASAEQLQQIARQLRRGLDATGWGDSERQRFEAPFNQTLKSINQLSDQMRSQYVPQLQKKAQVLDQYRV